MPVADFKNEDRAANSADSGPQAFPRLIDRLHKLARTEEEVTVGELVDAFEAQGHGPLLMIVALLMIVPIGMIPGVGGALGLLAAAVGVQMIIGSDSVWLPGFMRRRTVSADRIDAIVDRVRPVSVFLARHLEERLEWIAAGHVSLTIIAGLLIVAGGSLVILGAIPITVPLIGLPIAIFAVGILARDGAVVAAGYLVMAAAGAGVVALL